MDVGPDTPVPSRGPRSGLPIRLSRTVASGAVEAIGWRYLLDALATSVPVSSFDRAVRVASSAVTACGRSADQHLRVDLRPDRVEISLQTRAIAGVTDVDVELARAISAAVRQLDAVTGGATSSQWPTGDDAARPVQSLEVAIDALDIPAIRPFWLAVLAYVEVPDGAENAIADPVGQLPAVWFQQMDAPRPQRNRVHFDITVAHDEAQARVQRAIEAGGVLVDESHARSFWVLADAEGNEVCVCTWTDRDEREPT
jgi:4a-hydroxytetrahydrobiopterin dehydratase